MKHESQINNRLDKIGKQMTDKQLEEQLSVGYHF